MSQSYSYQVSRRSFLARTSCATLGINALVNTLAHLRLMDAAATTTGAGIGNDYKALVCIFLRGGCDMNNVVIPFGTNPQRLPNRSRRCRRAGVRDHHDQVEFPFSGRPTVWHASQLQSYGRDVQ